MSVTAAALPLSMNSSKRKEDENKALSINLKKNDFYGVVGSAGWVSVLTMQSQF